MRFDATSAAFYDTLRECGKPAKVAIVAIIRNQLVAAHMQQQQAMAGAVVS